jgi:toxin ParE1/3/4
MQPVEVRYRPEASRDLADIYRIVLRVSASPVTARRFVERIRERCRRIGVLPRAGRPRDDLFPGLRTVPFERKAVITYRVVEDHVEIVNVFYGGRDYEALYRRHEPQD